MSEHSQPPPEREDALGDECPDCQVELMHVAELSPQPEIILGEAQRIGELLCFARNRHCILGFSGCLPELQPHGDYWQGSSPEVTLCLDTTSWRHIFATQERSQSCGSMLGLEYFDENRCALFRTALTPDSDRLALQNVTHSFFQRCASADEFGAWRRMADISSPANHAFINEDFASMDGWSRPYSLTEGCTIEREMGFLANNLPLACAVFAEAIEERHSLVITVAGAFGHMSVPMTPLVLERIQRGWLYLGGEGRALRLNTSAIATYWIGGYRTAQSVYSYLEAIDVYGDLVFRVTADNPQSFYYWQALARNLP